MADLIIRKAGEEDAAAIWELEKACFDDPWSLDSISFELRENPHALYLLATEEDEAVGYMGIWCLLDEGQVTNVAVHPAHRGKHIAQRILEDMIRITTSGGIKHHTLEVRPSNAAAIGLYEKMGFKTEGRRKKYYQNNGEDALIMWRHEE